MFEEYQEKFLDIVRNSGNIIVVEGKKDRKALEKSGLENIFEISGKSLEKVVDIITGKKLQIIILTDYDKEGIKQYKRLKSLLRPTEIKINDNIRRKFKRIFKVNKIEELNSYFK